MQPLLPCTRPDFDGALFNFRIFLKLGAPTCLGPGASCPPCPPPLGGPVCRLEFCRLEFCRLEFCRLEFCRLSGNLPSLYTCMVNIIYLFSFVETPRKFIIAKLSTRKLGSSSVFLPLMKIQPYGSKALQ